ncbi:MAG: protein phosphatase 2C domain-containing protein [Gemmatimonadetes bacterium]|nr:protein phosphatase 2C domain-containing protein [Gemmatimonadota bacterium]
MATDDPPQKPRHSDIDAWGVTHTGKVRKENQDHFFVGSMSRGVVVDVTSVPEGERLVEHERLASFAMVADGVGSSGGGEEAARTAVQALVEKVAQTFHEAYLTPAAEPEAFTTLLTDAAMECHQRLMERAETDPEHNRYATTLTLFLGLWPHAYLLQVGDSRCYVFHDGELTQISRDQTMAQDLVDRGVLTQSRAGGTRWAHVLSSAIGGPQAEPVVTRYVRDWGTIVLLCSDGLTKHVSDERIKELASTLTSSRQLCEDLLQEALDDGGSDNITIIVGRTIKPDENA